MPITAYVASRLSAGSKAIAQTPFRLVRTVSFESERVAVELRFAAGLALLMYSARAR